VNSAINTIVGMISGIIGSNNDGLQSSLNNYHNPVITKESKVMPLVYIYLVLTVAVLLFAVMAVTAKK
jgi:hypothetical protein